MTYDEMVYHLNEKFQLADSWPLTYRVDPETYANVCSGIFKRKLSKVALEKGYTMDYTAFLDIAVGPHAGIKLRNVELILSSNMEETYVDQPSSSINGDGDRLETEKRT